MVFVIISYINRKLETIHISQLKCKTKYSHENED